MTPITLMGRPVMYLEDSDAVYAPSDIVFSNMDEYQMIENGSISQTDDGEIHITFASSEEAFRFLLRRELDGWSITDEKPAGILRLERSDVTPHYKRKRKHGGQWPKLRHGKRRS